MSRVVIFLVPNVHLLDLAGPAQVFSTAHELGYDYDLTYVAENTNVPTAQGLPVQAEVTWPDLHPTDLILVPGWRSPRLSTTPPLSAQVQQVLQGHHASGGSVASVCSGAAALGSAGLLDGRRYTTHHGIADLMAARYPNATIVRDVLYVEDDRVVTSAGIASGIDLCLHLVAVEHGAAAAAKVAREMVVYARRNGDERQDSVLLRHRAHLNDLAHRVQDVIDHRFADRLPLDTLAAGVGVSERTLTRAFTAATGLTPLRYQQLLRLERAEHLIGHGSTIESAAHAVGFDDARMLRRLRSRPQTPAMR